MTEQGELDVMDIIALWSLDIGFQNLELNRQQVDGIMIELQDKQDALLLKIISQNERIIQLLEELKCEKSKN